MPGCRRLKRGTRHVSANAPSTPGEDAIMEEPLARWNQPPWGWRGGEAAAASRIEPVLQRLGRIGSGRPEETSMSGSAEWPAGRLACRLHPPASVETLAETELRLG